LLFDANIKQKFHNYIKFVKNISSILLDYLICRNSIIKGVSENF